jgi:hypothetical protein
MSAWICNPEHIGLLAAFAARRHCVALLEPYAPPGVSAGYIARELARECIRSVATRYPNDTDGNRPGPGLLDREIIEQAGKWAAVYRSAWPEDQTDWHIEQHARCLRYQSCETDDWDQTPAARQVAAILAAVEGTPPPNPEPLVWGYEDERDIGALFDAFQVDTLQSVLGPRWKVQA